jgi:hypothetical protein
VRGVAEQARAKAGSRPFGVMVAAFVSVDEDGEKARSAGRTAVVNLYAGKPHPHNDSLLRQQGFVQLADDLTRLVAEGKPTKAHDAVPDDVVDELLIAGTQDDSARRLSDYAGIVEEVVMVNANGMRYESGDDRSGPSRGRPPRLFREHIHPREARHGDGNPERERGADVISASPRPRIDPSSGRRSPAAGTTIGELLQSLQDTRRQSLDRAKFWNICAQSSAVTAEVRLVARERREHEARHRDRLRELRRFLASPAPCPGADELAGYALDVRALARDCAEQTETLRRFLDQWRPQEEPTWLAALRVRSPLVDLLAEASPALG